MKPISKDAYQLLHDGVLALARAERAGIYVDVDYCQKMSAHIDRQVARLRESLTDSQLMVKWRRVYGKDFNPDSNQQLGAILFEHMGITPTKTTAKGGHSTDEDSLSSVDLPEVQDLLKIRRLTKARETYLGNFLREQVDGVIHTNFNLHLAATYRPSTDRPNLANVPNRNAEIKKMVRRGIKARPGHKLLAGDFKGVEVSIAYDYHLDPEMKIYLEDKTTDMHRDMAMRLYMLSKEQVTKQIRHSGKNEFVFPQFYGDWWKSCAKNLWNSAQSHTLPDGSPLAAHLAKNGRRTLADFEKHVESVENWMWHEKWPVYTQWKEDWLKAYHRQGYFDTLTGFRCQGLMSKNQVINYPIQGSAFHCMLQCIIWLDQDSMKEGWRSRICNQIYDDLMIDTHPDEEQMVVDRMRLYMRERLPEKWPWIKIPLDVEIEATPVDGSWYEKHEKHLNAILT